MIATNSIGNRRARSLTQNNAGERPSSTASLIAVLAELTDAERGAIFALIRSLPEDPDDRKALLTSGVDRILHDGSKGRLNA